MSRDRNAPAGHADLFDAMSRFYEAERRYSASNSPGDRSALLGTLHPDILLEQPASLPYGGRWQRREGFGQRLDLFVDAWTDIVPENAVHYPCVGDTLISTVTMRARARTTSVEIEMPMCQIILFKDGLPIHWRNFAWDTAAMLDALDPTTASAPRS